jgi:fructan beta-fructosidase
MSWGHAVSKDLINWKTLPVAIQEEKNKFDADTTMIFSGSAVFDKNNTSNLGTIENPPLVAIYTSFTHDNLKPKGQHQSIAYSLDKGTTWIKYEGNPVLDIKSLEFRDPKVFWYAPHSKWVMVVSKPDEHETWFYQSKNLKDWSLTSKWGKRGDTSKFWECPDLFELPVLGTNEKKWVMLSSAGHPQQSYFGMQYFIGDFDGNKFVSPEEYKTPTYLDFGKDYYAAVSYNDAPANRRIVVGWMNNWEYAKDIPTGDIWRGAYAIPREFNLIKSGNGYKLIQQPIAEFNNTLKEVFSAKDIIVDSMFNLPYKGVSYQLELTIEPGKAKNAGVKILKSKNEETVLTFDNASKLLLLDRTKSGNVNFNSKFPSVEKAPVTLNDGKFTVKVLVDKCIVEVFINNGESTITNLVFPLETDGGIQLFSSDGQTNFRKVSVHQESE